MRRRSLLVGLAGAVARPAAVWAPRVARVSDEAELHAAFVAGVRHFVFTQTIEITAAMPIGLIYIEMEGAGP